MTYRDQLQQAVQTIVIQGTTPKSDEDVMQELFDDLRLRDYMDPQTLTSLAEWEVDNDECPSS